MIECCLLFDSCGAVQGNKANLWRRFRDMRALYGKTDFDFVPESYVSYRARVSWQQRSASLKTVSHSHSLFVLIVALQDFGSFKTKAKATAFEKKTLELADWMSTQAEKLQASVRNSTAAQHATPTWILKDAIANRGDSLKVLFSYEEAVEVRQYTAMREISFSTDGCDALRSFQTLHNSYTEWRKEHADLRAAADEASAQVVDAACTHRTLVMC